MNTSGFQLHYRSAFDLRRKPDSTSGWRSIAEIIQVWLAQKARGPQFNFGQHFFSRGEWQNSESSRTIVRVESATGRGSVEVPEFWAMLYEHPCGQVTSRRWQTQIGLTHPSSDLIHVAITTIHWLPDYVGDEPPPPIPTSPQVVSRLISNTHWQASSGTELLSANSKLQQVGRGDEFLERLKDDGRSCPIVYVAREHNSERLLVDPIRLARNLAGMAAVYTAENTEVDEELENFLESNFRCANGMVRVYQPNIRFDVSNDFRRHRFFPRAYIVDRGAFHTEELIVKGLARRSLKVLPNSVSTVDDVLSRAREARLTSLRAEVESAAGQREMIDLFTEEIRKIEERAKGLEEENRTIAAERDELDDKVDRLEYENAIYQQRAAATDDRDATLQAQVDAVRNLAAFPKNLYDLVKLVSGIYSDRLHFTERALRSAHGYSIDLGVAWECLRSMATVLYDLYFTQQLTVREIAQEFRSKSGYELGLFDSETTKNNKKLAALRQDVFQGKRIDISAHVKHRNSKPNLLRVHFFPHREKKILVIGHCADHLDTMRTN
jgi:FtsZ-binding cell division protein ZapB